MRTSRIGSKLMLLTMLALLLAGCGGDNSSGGGSSSSSGSGGSSTNSGNSSSSSGSTNSGNSSSSGFNPSDLQVTSTGSYTSGIGLYYYIGVVKNNGSATLKQIKISLVDDNGNVVPSDKAPELTLLLAVLAPGKSAGFNIQAVTPVNKPSFKFDAQVVTASDLLQPVNLSVSNDKLDPSGQKVDCTLTNNSDGAAFLWTMNTVGYDASGKVVAVASGGPVDINAIPNGIPAHGSVPFEANFANMLSNSSAKVAKYDIFASGLQNSVK